MLWNAAVTILIYNKRKAAACIFTTRLKLSWSSTLDDMLLLANPLEAGPM